MKAAFPVSNFFFLFCFFGSGINTLSKRDNITIYKSCLVNTVNSPEINLKGSLIQLSVGRKQSHLY